jgi:hypothetical protein
MTRMFTHLREELAPSAAAAAADARPARRRAPLTVQVDSAAGDEQVKDRTPAVPHSPPYH